MPTSHTLASSTTSTCERYPFCPETPDFELIKPSDTQNPNYFYRDNKYLCFYLATPQWIKSHRDDTPETIMQTLVDHFDQFGGSTIRLNPMPLPSSPKEIQRFLAQLRVYQDCEPVPALVTIKVWKASNQLIYVDVKHTPDKTSPRPFLPSGKKNRF